LLLAGSRPEQIDHARAQLAKSKTQVREMKIAAPPTASLKY